MSEDSYALRRAKRIMQAVADDEWDDVDADACVALAEAIIAQDRELRALRRENYDLRTAVIHVADSASEYHRVRAMVGKLRAAANHLHVPFDLAAVLATDDGAK